MRVALTGGMGCGKTTALGYFEELGWKTLRSDALVHAIYCEDRSVREALADRYGPEVLNEEGVDRQALGKEVFGDEAELAWLEELVHPRVRERWEAETAAEGVDLAVVEIPLLFEKGLDSAFLLTVSVGAPQQVQRRRLLARDLPEAEIERRLARQLPLPEKARRATLVLSNSGPLDFLQAQVAWADKQLRSFP